MPNERKVMTQEQLDFWVRRIGGALVGPHDLARFFGGRLPAEGAPMQVIHGVRVRVAPLQGEKPLRGKRHTHRVLVQCPDCDKEMSAGRLHQHLGKASCKGLA